jgi:hypothetical protein
VASPAAPRPRPSQGRTPPIPAPPLPDAAGGVYGKDDGLVDAGGVGSEPRGGKEGGKGEETIGLEGSASRLDGKTTGGSVAKAGRVLGASSLIRASGVDDILPGPVTALDGPGTKPPPGLPPSKAGTRGT